MLSRRAVLHGLAVAAAPLHASAQDAAPTHAETRRVAAPYDHDAPHEGRFDLEYGLLRTFDPRRPSVFIVADGQQFYLSPANFARALNPLFADDRFNVVGVFGRASAPALHERVGRGDGVNWAAAYRFYRSRQWIGDLELVRRELVGARGQVRLYGRSGGALLAHEYMARHGGRVAAAFTQATVNHYLAGRLGLESDRFWSELSESDRTALAAYLSANPERRIQAAFLLQRQNFFVPHTELAGARTSLITDLVANNSTALDQRAEQYQVNAIRQMTSTPRGAAIAVRLYEFYQPTAHMASDGFRPDKEVMADLCAPLLGAAVSPAPGMNFSALRRVRGDVTLVAGRWDHTCDYRTQAPLAAFFPSARLLLLDDNHQFHRINEMGLGPALVNAAMQGFASPAYAQAQSAIEPLIWRGE